LAVAGGIGPVSTSTAQAAVTPHTTPGSQPTEFYFASGEGDYIGVGQTVDYTDPTVSISADMHSISASVAGWSLGLSAPSGQQLAPGTYTGATRFAFLGTGTGPGIDLDGNGRGCNQDYGSFTIYEISATTLNATFSQTCESNTAAPLVGFIRYNATTTTPIPTLPSSAQPITDPPNSGTTTANANEFSFRSSEGDAMGGGRTVDYTGAGNVSLSGALGHVRVGAGGWMLDLAAPSGQQLVPGTYTGATDYFGADKATPQISVSTISSTCGTASGTFTVYEITSDPTGTMTSLNATFSENCNSSTTAPLVGFIRYNATVPTPVPSLAASSAEPITDPPNSGTTSSSAEEFSFRSGAGDYIGNGASVDYTGASSVSVSGTLGQVSFSAGGYGVSLAAPAGQQLTPGTYTGAISGPANPGTAAGVEMSGPGVGCNNNYGSFTIYEITSDSTGTLTSLNATFSHSCESPTAPPAVGFVRYNATVATPIPTLPSSAGPITDPPNSGTTNADADEFSFLSNANDGVAAGASADYVGASNVQVSGTLGVISVFAGPWSMYISAPRGEQLAPGTYTGATPYPFNSGSAPGFTLSGNHLACTDSASFTVYEISSDSTGKLSSLNATFSRSCGPTTPSLTGFIRFNATQPTPVPTVPPALGAALKATTGAAAANGETTVTLDASGSTNTDSGTKYSFSFGDGTSAVSSSSPVVSRAEPEGTYEVDVTVTDSTGRSSTAAPQWLTVGDGYHPVNPTRLLDTRYGTGAAGPVASGHLVTLQLPSSITSSGHGPLRAVVLNVTVTQPTAGGYIRVYPDGLSQTPTTSSLNYAKGETVANLVTVPVGADGKVVFSVQQSSGTAQVIADLEGYYTAGDDPTNAGYAPLTPTRIMDTRHSVGGVGGRLAGWGHVRLTLPSSVPAGATAVALNVTAVGTSASGNVKVYPDGLSVPNASNLNFAAGGTVPNLVIVPVPTDRVIDFYLESPGSADLLADLEGYYSTSATAKFVPFAPTRLLDTRTGVLGGPLPSGWDVSVSMAYGLQVPSSALTAGLYNVTVTQPQASGFVSVFPDGLTTPPNVSNVNFGKGETVANATLAAMTDGKQDFFNGSTAPTQLVVDFFGYFAQPLATTAPPSSADVSTTGSPIRARLRTQVRAQPLR
jgi:hypothetical protein